MKVGRQIGISSVWNRQTVFWIGAVEYVIRGVVSVGCDGVGRIVNGGDEEMAEEGQNRRSDAAT